MLLHPFVWWLHFHAWRHWFMWLLSIWLNRQWGILATQTVWRHSNNSSIDLTQCITPPEPISVVAGVSSHSAVGWSRCFPSDVDFSDSEEVSSDGKNKQQVIKLAKKHILALTTVLPLRDMWSILLSPCVHSDYSQIQSFYTCIEQSHNRKAYYLPTKSQILQILLFPNSFIGLSGAGLHRLCFSVV